MAKENAFRDLLSIDGFESTARLNVIRTYTPKTYIKEQLKKAGFIYVGFCWGDPIYHKDGVFLSFFASCNAYDIQKATSAEDIRYYTVRLEEK